MGLGAGLFSAKEMPSRSMALRIAMAGPPLDVRKDYSMLSALGRSEEHTSELQSLMRISYAVFCLKKKKREHTLTEGRTERYQLITNIRHTTNQHIVRQT